MQRGVEKNTMNSRNGRFWFFCLLFFLLWQEPTLAAQPMLAAGLRHSVYVDKYGGVSIWGDNTFGQLGGPSYQDVHASDATYNPLGLRRARVLGSGWNHILVATRPTKTRNPTLWSWGLGDVGQLGIGPIVPLGGMAFYQVRMPFPVLGDIGSKDFVMLKGGTAHSLALTKNGEVLAWGWNQVGQLGLGDLTNRWTAYKVKSLPPTMTAIAVGGDFSLALDRDGTVWGWGNNARGQLGGGEKKDTPVMTPMRIAQSQGIGLRAIAAGTAFALALDENGVVYAWGDNTHGQLGRGDDPTATQPDKVHGLPPIAGIAAGGDYGLALDKEGMLWAWGLNDRGQLGDGTTVMRSTPQPVPGLGKVQVMAAGVEHALALQEDGALMAWGDDRAYQLGVQLAEERSLHPVIVTLKRHGREKN